MVAGYMCKETRIFNVPRSFFTWSYRLFPPIRKKLVQLTGSLVVDSSKFKRMMNWIPPHTLEEGIKDMVSDYLSRSRNLVS
jgi:nucleoside-diphosphate-sugar epimerase